MLNLNIETGNQHYFLLKFPIFTCFKNAFQHTAQYHILVTNAEFTKPNYQKCCPIYSS